MGFVLPVCKGLGRYVAHALHLELSLVDVHRLGESVGEEEDGCAREDLCFLQGIFPCGPEAHGYVVVAGQFSDAFADKQGCIVACIAVVQVACGQVEHSDEEGDEHVGLVHADHCSVHGCDNFVGLRLAGGDGAEHSPGDCHEKRGGHTFARDVADAEEELLVAEVEVEQVAAHIFGRGQRGIDLNVVAVGPCGELIGQHAHLYAACDADVPVYRSFLGCCVLQLFDVFNE